MANRADSGPVDIDSLFQLPLGEFTAARNALTATLKKARRAADAATVKTIEKPSVSAWAVNQAYWRHRVEFNKLLAAGDRFRDAQRAQLGGTKADLRGTLDARSAALNAVANRAAEALRKAGHEPTPDLMRRIATTLESVATYGTLPGAPPAGRLSVDIEPPGFEALATLVPVGVPRERGSAPPRVLTFAQKAPKKAKSSKDPAEVERRRQAELAAQRAAAKKALETAKANELRARHAAKEAQAALKKAAARAKAAEQERVKAEKRIEKIVSEAQEAAKEARQVARTAEEAAQALSDAEREVERAAGALNALGPA